MYLLLYNVTGMLMFWFVIILAKLIYIVDSIVIFMVYYVSP